jgi:GNAT superfamily N-acetyltransferase
MAKQQEPVTPRVQFAALGPDRWDDFERLFGSKGACGGCWCMYPRLSHKEFEAGKGASHRRAMRKLVAGGRVPGIVGYVDSEPVAWCSIEPRALLATLGRSRILAAVDEVPVWSIVCLFVARGWRRRGVSVQMIESAVTFAAAAGAVCVEAYPVEPKKNSVPAAFAWTGLAAAYRSAGFEEVVRRSPTRPIMRRWLAKRPRA